MKIIRTTKNDGKETEEIEYTSFELSDFSKLKNYKERITYCNDLLRRIGAGSSRIVYEINAKQVLKIAKNIVGIEQNETEARSQIQQKYSDIVTFCYHSHTNFLWAVMERAKPVRPAQFKELCGIAWKDFQHYITYQNGVLHKNTKIYIEDGVLDAGDSTILTQRLLELCKESGVSLLDVSKITSWGVVDRNGVPVLVLVDFGAIDTHK